MLYKEYAFGDCAVYYVLTSDFGVGLAIWPKKYRPDDFGALCCDSMVQVSLRGDRSLADYTQGLSMRNRSSVLLQIASQTAGENGVVTRLSDGGGNEYTHHLEYDERTGVFSVFVEYKNNTGREQVLESLQSFSLSGICDPAARPLSDAGSRLVRMSSAWSRECRFREDDFIDIGMESSWARYGTKCERFGQVGSMPNRAWFPFAAVVNKSATWAAMIEAPYSWQMELCKEKETCALSGGLADREFGHWYKKIASGEQFSTHRAYIAVRAGDDVCGACNALIRFQSQRLALPESEKDLPILYNEYCTTWGVPSEENIASILKSIEGMPFDYFVIDAGWYKPDDGGWGNATGDWNENKTLFPRGIVAVSEMIRNSGKKAGIWFEFENAGRDSEAFYREDMLLQRDGTPLTAKNRRFFDLRKPQVQDYITRKVCDFLQKNKFEYIKIDYNDAYGIGCDGAESLGEGGRQVAEESIAWLGRFRKAVPGLVIENCASGGSRIEPLRMREASMCSFSDAHECVEIPLVAANVARVIPARQSQIWAVIRENDSLARIVWSLAAAMMGRICISGDVNKIGEEQREKLRAGLDFYQKIKHILADGEFTGYGFHNTDVRSLRDPVGSQCFEKSAENGKYLLRILHFFKEPAAGYIHAATPARGYRLAEAYTTLPHRVEQDELRVQANRFEAGAFLFVKEG